MHHDLKYDNFLVDHPGVSLVDIAGPNASYLPPTSIFSHRHLWVAHHRSGTASLVKEKIEKIPNHSNYFLRYRFPRIVLCDFGEASVVADATETTVDSFGNQVLGNPVAKEFNVGWEESGTKADFARGAVALQPPEMQTAAKFKDRRQETFDRRGRFSIGPEADIWSCGVLFLQVLLGEALPSSIANGYLIFLGLEPYTRKSDDTDVSFKK